VVSLSLGAVYVYFRENRFISGPDCWGIEESGDANDINKRMGSSPAVYQKLGRIVNNKEKDF
jgi:hypothetical protein